MTNEEVIKILKPGDKVILCNKAWMNDGIGKVEKFTKTMMHCSIPRNGMEDLIFRFNIRTGRRVGATTWEYHIQLKQYSENEGSNIKLKNRKLKLVGMLRKFDFLNLSNDQLEAINNIISGEKQ